jgi:hypothetical protein
VATDKASVATVLFSVTRAGVVELVDMMDSKSLPSGVAVRAPRQNATGKIFRAAGFRLVGSHGRAL